jgi:hypothetical protein
MRMSKLFAKSLVYTLVFYSFLTPAAEARKAAQAQPSTLPAAEVPAPQETPTQPTAPTAPSSNGWPAMSLPEAPVVVPPITYFDIATGKFGALQIILKDGEFASAKVDTLRIDATNLDLTQGVLKTLNIQFDNGKFKDFNIDRLSMSSQGNLVFDTGMFLTHRILQFSTPATAAVIAEISQSSLNSYLNSPRTLQKLSVTAGQKMAALTSILGANFGLVFSQANVVLEPQNRAKLTAIAKLGAGDAAVPLPIVADSHVGLRSGWVALDDTHIVTAGSELPPDISNMLINKINSLANWGEKSEDIHFSFNEIKVLPDDKLVLTGTAQIYRLVLGRKSD